METGGLGEHLKGTEDTAQGEGAQGVSRKTAFQSSKTTRVWVTSPVTLTLLTRHHGRGIGKLGKNIRVLDLLSKQNIPGKGYQNIFFQVTIITRRQPGGQESMREALGGTESQGGSRDVRLAVLIVHQHWTTPGALHLPR